MFDVIIVANGKSIRCGTDKLVFNISGNSVLSRTVNAFLGVKDINKIILVSDSSFDIPGTVKVGGGATRALSVKAGLNACESEFVLIHDGARPFLTRDLINRVMADTVTYGSSVPCLPITDSVRYVKNGIPSFADRNDFVTLQTPQGFSRKEIISAYEAAEPNEMNSYDDSQIYARYIKNPHLTSGEKQNKKITTPEDLIGYNVKAGSGFDVHKFEDNGKPLILGGVSIPYERGLDAHSDGDVVIHAIIDSLLSAINERDIGVLFPDSDAKYKNIDSCLLLSEVKKLLDDKNAVIINVSVTVILQAPKISHFIPLMQNRISKILNVNASQINITATTTEGLGIVGEKKAVAVLSIASLC